MRGRNWIGGVALLAFAGAASGAAVMKDAAANEGSPVSTKPLAQDCAAHSFETTIALTGPDGRPKQSKVHMCGTIGQSNADWIRTLKDAVSKTAENPAIPQAAKEQIIAAVNLEITRLSIPALQLQPGADISKLPKSAVKTTEVPLSRDYDVLPPLPTASTVAPPHVLGPGGTIVPAPRLTLRCALVGDESRPTNCDSIDRETVIVFRADDAYPHGIEVRFVRHGDQRAELDLPALKQGQTASVRLPPAVCTGVVRSNVEIQALGANSPSGAIAGTIGEYDLRC